jgi:uncharacterized membrane protein
VLTGLVLIAPLYLTFWLLRSFVNLIDDKVGTVLPDAWNPHTYFDIPGYGLVMLALFSALLGALAKNFVMAKLIGWGERLLDQLPVVRSIYNGIKQIAHTVLVQSDKSFEKACLVEYPRKGIWAIAFISTQTRGEVRERAGRDTMMSVFLPTTPNPTSGFLLFVPKEDVIELDMSVEDAAKLVISAGLVHPPERPKADPAAAPEPLAAE